MVENAARLPADLRREDELSKSIIGAAIAVHRAMGPGLLESVYHECMLIELDAVGMKTRSEVSIPLEYRGRKLNAAHRLDLLVEELVVVELKAVEALAPIHDAQLLTYLRLTGKRLGMLFNFNVPYLKDGMRRLVL